MAIDSTAELLFRINADSADAEGNIKRFRSVMSKDLSDIGAEFGTWSKGILGDLSTVQGATLAGFAALAAGAVAVGAALEHAGNAYQAYAVEVSKGMKLTGMSAEQMSTLHFAAKKVGVEYDSLVNGMLKFSATIVHASQGNEAAAKAFGALGLTQKDVVAGQNDLYGLLGKTMDAFHNNTSAVQKAAMARDLFGRGGTELLNFLSKGSEGLAKMGEKAHELGLILTNEDIRAVREFKLAQKELKEQSEAVEVTLGKATQGARLWAQTMLAATMTAAVSKGFISDLIAAFGNPTMMAVVVGRLSAQYSILTAEIEKATKAAANSADQPPLLATDKGVKALKESYDNYYGISSIVEQLAGKLAAGGDAQDRLNQEVAHYNFELQKAVEELAKLSSEGKLTDAVFGRETAAMAQIAGMIDQIRMQATQKAVEAVFEAEEKQMAALDEVHRHLVEKLSTYDADSWNRRRAQANKEVDDMAAEARKKATLTSDEEALLVRIRKASLDQIDREQNEAWQKEMLGLRKHLETMALDALNGAERLNFEYQRNLAAFSAVEEAKALKTAQSEAEQEAIRQMYSMARTSLTEQYGRELQTLVNSQGWQGVFGNHFAEMLRGNEQLLRQWASSTNQSLLMVRVAMESLKEMGKQAFGQFAQGMGQNIAQAIVYSKSIGQAMRAALAATLESLAGQAFTQAIYATGLGFLRLALGDPAGAGEAFTAAAIFGTVGAAAAVVGRAIAPKDAAGGAGGGSGAGSGGGAAAGASGGTGTSSTGTADNRPHLTIVVQGHVIGSSGQAELLDLINSYVYENDGTLIASHNREGVAL